MPNIKNLQPEKYNLAMRTKEEQQRITSMGGKASGEARRNKKLFETAVLDILTKKDPKSKEGATNLELAVAAVLRRAKSGDVKANEFLRDTIGEKPIQEIEQHNTGAVGIGMFEGVSTEQLKANLEAVDRLSQTQVEQLDE